MTENQEFIYESIVSQVRMGFLPVEEIKEIVLEQVEDNEFEDEISEEWVNSRVDSEFEKLKGESKSWTGPTDTDKLVKAFDELCTLKIIALHNAGYTTSDGEEEVIAVEEALRESGVKSVGYCFYHEQDLERAIDPKQNNLLIAFQKVDNNDDKVTLEVGKLVAQTLKKNGFEVKWNETVNKKIEILNFRWRKIYNEGDDDLLDYNRVLDIMIK
jgi:hypothetical protein